MRNRNLPLPALACLLAAWTVPGHAQFKDPVPAELQMLSDAKFPGADALGLDMEETADDQTHLRDLYRRIKVLTEKGKELATVRMPYLPDQESLVTVDARTIHADGSIIPMSGAPADLTELQAKKFRVQTIVFTLPSVEIGSIVEYHVKFRMRDKMVAEPVWEVQQNYPVRKAHFSLHSFVPKDVQVTDRYGNYRGILLYSAHLPGNAVVNYDKATDTHSLDIKDIPSAPNEDWMPPRNSWIWRVEFFYTDAIGPFNFWMHAGESWRAQLDAFLKPSGRLNKAAAGLVAPSDSPVEKARKIYEAVQQLDNTDFSRAKTRAERKKEKLKEIRTAEDVWNQKSGSSDEITLLYVALAQAAGLRAFAGQVSNRDRTVFDEEYFSTGQLDDFIAIVELSAGELDLDPGQKMCPFGEMHWKHTNTAGLRMMLGSPSLFKLTLAPRANTSVQRSVTLAVGPDGSVKGKIRVTMNGAAALYWRQTALVNDLDEVKKQFSEELRNDLPEETQTQFNQFDKLDDPASPLVAELEISGSLGAPTGKHFILPALFFSRAKHPFESQEARTTPIDMHYPRSEQEIVAYTLPEGYTTETAPPPFHATWPDHGTFSIECAVTPGGMRVARTLITKFTTVSPADYGALHDFFRQVVIADQAQLVLTRSAVTKAN